MEATASETRTTTAASEAIDARYRCRIETFPFPARILLLFGINTGALDFVRCTGAGAPKEQLCAIRQCEVTAVGPARSVLGLVPVDDNLLPGLDGILCNTSPHQDVRAACFNGPVFNLAVGTLHIDID